MQNIQIGYMMLIHAEKVLSLDDQFSEDAGPKRFMRKGVFIIEMSGRIVILVLF